MENAWRLALTWKMFNEFNLKETQCEVNTFFFRGKTFPEYPNLEYKEYGRISVQQRGI